MTKNSKRFGQGRSATKFSYTYEDISKLANMTPGAVQKHVQRGNLDPKNLVSVLEFIKSRLQPLVESVILPDPVALKDLAKSLRK